MILFLLSPYHAMVPWPIWYAREQQLKGVAG